jgi:hypothetical protein
MAALPPEAANAARAQTSRAARLNSRPREAKPAERVPGV